MVTAQIQGGIQPGSLRTVQPPSGLTDVGHRRALVASVTGNGVPDVVCIATATVAGVARDVALLAAAPGIHTAYNQLKGTGTMMVTDAAVLRAAAGGGRDALAIVSPTGLYRWSLEPDSEGRNIVRLGGNLWNGALTVRAGRLDGDAQDDIVGVVASGTRLRALPSSDATWFYELNAPIADVAVADFCAEAAGSTPVDEIAVATADGLSVFVGKAIHATVPLPNTGMHIQPLHSPVGCLLAVAWDDTSATPGHHLWVFDGNLSVVSAWDTAPAIQGMTASDADQDGDDDLLVTVVGVGNAKRLNFTGTGTGFTSHHIPYGSGVFPGGAGIAPVDVDFDGDGDADMVLPNANGAIAFLRNLDVADGGTFYQRRAHNPSLVDFRFSSQVARPAWASHIEVVQWQLQRVIPAGGGAVTGLVLLPQSSPRQTFAIEPSATAVEWDAYSTIPLAWSLTEDPLVIATRFVKLAGEDVVQRGGVTLSAIAMGLDDDALLQDLLQQHGEMAYDLGGAVPWSMSTLVADEGSAIALQFGSGYAPEADNTRGIGVVIDPPDLPEPKDGDTPQTPEEPEGG